MSQIQEFQKCFDELDELRAKLAEKQRTPNDELLQSVAEMAQNQLSSLRTVNEFINKFSSKGILKDRLEFDSPCIVMPDRNSVLNLTEASKAALEIHNELATKSSESVPRKEAFEREKMNLNRFSLADLNNHDFGRCFKNMVQYYTGQSEVDDFGNNTTVATFISDEVMASSPI